MSNRVEEWDRTVLPELNVPSREGWKVDVDTGDKRGPVYSASNKQRSESFFLSNRPFEVIDYYVNFKFLALFIKKIKENPGRKIVILDLGGGVESQAARGILRHPFLRGRVKVINVDLFAREIDRDELIGDGIDPDDIVIVNGDFASCDCIEPGSVDAVISYQVLDNINGQRLFTTLDKVAEVLAPGGEAYMDEMWRITQYDMMGSGFAIYPTGYMPAPGVYIGGGSFNSDIGALSRITRKHNVFIGSTHRETQLDGTTHIFGGGMGMVYMAKPYDGRFFERGPFANDFRLAYPEIVNAVKDYGVKIA